MPRGRSFSTERAERAHHMRHDSTTHPASPAAARIKILCIFGTRPEAIKMAPIVRLLRASTDRFETRVCVTAQHRDMLDQVLRVFSIAPDHDLDSMRDAQSPTQVAAAVLAKLEPILHDESPDWI